MKSRYFAWIAVAAMMAACDSPLETDPTASIDAGTALSNKRGVDLAVNGAYRSLQSVYGLNQLVYPDLYSDNLDFTGTFQTDREFSLRAVTTSNTTLRDMWASLYNTVNRANNILAAADDAEGMTDAERATARGEALFIRALAYSVLVNWWGGVPIVTEPSTGITEASLVSRNTRQEALDFLETDLEEASTLLGTARRNGRATRASADALAARMYLEEGEYAKARDKATAVINNTNYRMVTNYADIFRTKNSTETLFEIQHNVNNQNSIAFWYFPATLGGRYGFAPSATLDNAFEAGDPREPVTIALSGTSRYGNKYTRISTGDDQPPVLRVAEQYLIRAEANARLNAAADIVRADINIVRARAGRAPIPTTVTSQAELLDAILAERRVEFALEGLRFFDLRRFGRAQTVLAITADKLLMPIPQAELDVNKNLTQNPGY
jgi:starch-binding outer membrane protein, SusD/RagB family